jgi:hypothetical protein
MHPDVRAYLVQRGLDPSRHHAGLDPQAIDLERQIRRGRLMKNSATPREFDQADGRQSVPCVKG